MKKAIFTLICLLLAAPLMSGPIDEPIDSILIDYFQIHSALADDTTAGVTRPAKSISEKAESVVTDNAEIGQLLIEIRNAAGRIQEAKDLEAARSDFFDLSKPLLIYLNQYHAQKDSYYRFFCPMAKKGWIQAEEGARNPYHGSSMLACGTPIR